MKQVVRLLGFIRPFGRPVAGVAALGFASVAGNVALLFGAALLLARAALHPVVLLLMPLVALVRLAGLTRAVSRYLERYFAHDVTFRVLGRLQVWFYGALEALAPAQLRDWHSGDLFGRLVGDVESLQDFYLRVVAPVLTAAAVLAGLFFLLAAFDLELALVYTAFFLAGGAGVALAAWVLNRPVGGRLAEEGARLNACLVDSLQGMWEIVAFGRTERQLREVAAVHRSYVNLQCRSQSRGSLAGALVGTTANLAGWSILVLGIARHLPGVYLGALVLAALAGFEAMSPLAGIFGHLKQNLAAAGRLFAVTDLAPAVVDQAGAVVPQAGPHDLVVEGLSFRYGPDAPWVLQNVGFTLPRGGRVAVVGPSGTGKSTLVGILTRLLDYEEGSVRLDGRELKEYTAAGVRACLAVVEQNPHLFYATVRENLLLARPRAAEGELDAALSAAGAAFVWDLPQGGDTCTGEGGVGLSGGQRQRLAIARALLKDAPILVLDEPETGLDAPTAREVLAAVAAPGRSLLLITHRLAGLETMDEIIVLDRGAVVERGRHEVLLVRGGLYRRLWELQQAARPVSSSVRPA